MFGGQRFLRHVAAETPWTPFNGGEAQETGITRATGGLAEVRDRSAGGIGEASVSRRIDGELVFGFVLDGSAALDYARPSRARSSATLSSSHRARPGPERASRRLPPAARDHRSGSTPLALIALYSGCKSA